MAAGKNTNSHSTTPAPTVHSLKGGLSLLNNWRRAQGMRLTGVLKHPIRHFVTRAEVILSPAFGVFHRAKLSIAGIKARRAFSAWVCIFLLLAQVLCVAAAIAQSKVVTPKNVSGDNAAELSPDGSRTQDTVPNPYIDAPGFVPLVNNSADVNVEGGGYNGGSTRGIKRNVNDILKRDNPMGAAEQGAQPKVFSDMEDANGQTAGSLADLLGQGEERARSTLAMQAAEQQRNNPQTDISNLLQNNLGSINETYRGMHQWFNDDIVGNLFSQIGQLIGKWLSELVNGWIADTVQFLAAFLRVFVLNPNVAVNGLNGSPDDGISTFIRQGADVMYGIACDLLLLLFILAIWKYWTEAAWRGAGNLMGAVGRLIATAGLMLAFPTLYAFEIQISNEMIKAIYFNSSNEVLMLDSALASAVRGGILAGAGGLASAFAPVLGGLALGPVGGTVGEMFAFAGLMLFTILGGILIAELVYILILKAIQTALLTAQYMFAPVFLVFFATPDTENVATGFVRSWVETSLWTFVWVGLLKIMVIIMFSDYNPWGKILMSIGILQIMIQVPSFLARAQISPMSDFISAGLITGMLFKGFGGLANFAKTRTGQAISYFANDRFAASGIPQTSTPTLDNVNRQAGNPDLVKQYRNASQEGQQKPNLPGVQPPPVKTGQESKDPADALAKQAAVNGQPLQNPAQRQAGGVPPAKNPAAATGMETTMPTGGLQTPAAAGGGVPAKPGDTPATGLGDKPADKPINPAANPAVNPVKPGDKTTTPGAPDPALKPAADAAKTMGAVAGTAAAIGGVAAAAGGRSVSAPAAGGLTPGAKLDDVFNPERKLGTDYYNNPGLVAVDAVRSVVGNIKTLGIRVQEGADANGLEGTARGGASIIKLREGASAAEKAHVLMSAGLAGKMQSDPAAMDAARQSAIDAGGDRPQGLMENLAANWLAYSGGTFKQTALAKGRFQRAMYAQAAKGSQDYIGGHQGNAYSEYLRGRYGSWTPDMDASAVWLATDPDASESAWNPAIGPATDALAASGLAITGATRGAIQNPLVMTMRPGARKAAVRALLRACMYDDRMKGEDPNSMAGGIKLGEIARSMPESFVQTAIAVDAVSGGRDLAPDNIQQLAQLSSELNVPADTLYRSSAMAAGWIGHAVTGNRSMLGARNFDQVRQIVRQQHGGDTESARAEYQVILSETADRVRGMSSLGVSTRMMTEPGFANDVHQFMDTYGGSLDDMKNPVGGGQAMLAAATTAKLFGSAGFTQSRAQAVLRLVQEGNNAGSLSTQDVVVAERLVAANATGLNQTVIGVTRNLYSSNQTLGANELNMIQDVSSSIENGVGRVDQSVHIARVIGSNVPVTKQTIEVAARLSRQPGGFNEGIFKVEADLVQNNVVNSAGEAHMAFSNCLSSVARGVGFDPSGMNPSEIMGEIQRLAPDANYSYSTVGQVITNMSRTGGFGSEQLTNPVVVDLAFQAMSEQPTNTHRMASIQVAQRIHGTDAICSSNGAGGYVMNESMLQVYDDVLEAGVEPQRMNEAKYYAASALQQYKTAQSIPKQSGPQPTYPVLERITQDSRFKLNNAKNQAPTLDQGIYDDLNRMGRWTS